MTAPTTSPPLPSQAPSRTVVRTTWPTPTPTTAKPTTATDVLALQNARGRPAVSLLLSTTPAPRLTPPDDARLAMLLREAERRLALDAENGRPDPDLLAALHQQAAAARQASTRRGLALFAGRSSRGVDQSAFHHLDVGVRDRVSIGPVFATRDLIRSLHRTPRHLLLVLTNDRAQLFDGLGSTLTEVTRGFPVRRPGGSASHDASEFFARVDDALGFYLADNPAPLVIAAPARPLNSLLLSSRNLQRLAGTIPGFWHDADTDQLVQQVRPVLLAYLRNRQLEALSLLEARERQSRTVSGLQQVWAAARTGPVEMLAVEEDHFAPARLSADRRRITPAQDLGAPDVLDDAVDEIIDLVLSRGGWVALVDSGALADHDHLCVSLRKKWSPPTQT